MCAGAKFLGRDGNRRNLETGQEKLNTPFFVIDVKEKFYLILILAK